jgi:regulator of CtrA degradation
VDTEWLLSTLFDASLLSLEPPENGGSFLFLFQNRTADEARILLHPPRDVGDRGFTRSRFIGMRWTRRRSAGMVEGREGASMSEEWVDAMRPVLFGEKLAASQNFSQLFRDGMKLVEETAAYLDGPGRRESKGLGRAAALGYATESMRLTTRLMQLASWLLLHRAVNEGEMSLAQANRERMKVKLSADERPDDPDIVLPESLTDLVARSRKLQEEVRRLDATIHAPLPQAHVGTQPLRDQLAVLRAAFESRA